MTNARRYYVEEGRVGDSCVLPSDIRRDYPPDDPINSPIPAFSAGFVIAREVFETFKEVEVPKGLIADDPVFARRALLLKGLHVDLEPVFCYGTSRTSASGGGVSGKNWIIDRYRRWCLLEQDIRVLRPVTMGETLQLARLKKRMLLDAKLIDCSILVWPFLWVRMWFISGDEAVAALKKRIKLILTGSVNASARQSRLLRLFRRG